MDEITNAILDSYKEKAEAIIKDNHKKYFDDFLEEFDKKRGELVAKRFHELRMEYHDESSEVYQRCSKETDDPKKLNSLIETQAIIDLEDYFKQINKTSVKEFDLYKQRKVEEILVSWEDEIQEEVNKAHDK